MGYYTDFTIEQATDEQVEALQERSGYNLLGHCLYGAKWYDWKDDLEYVSRQFPATVIVLTGSGEDFPDLWQATALGGKVTVKRGRVVYD